MIHAFISGGELLIRENDDKPRIVESTFLKTKIEETENRRSLHDWKNHEGDESNPYGGSNLWGRQSSVSQGVAFRFKSVFPGKDDEIYYTLCNGAVTGLFRQELKSGKEYRLFHRNDFHEWGLDYSTDRDEFVAAVQCEDAQVDLELLRSDGVRLKPVTGGDSQDTHPTFSLKDSNSVVFQSRGIGRVEGGDIVGFSPDIIQRINVESGEVIEVLGDDDFDYLLPREDKDGNVYCIRRPHGEVERPSEFRQFLNFLMLPFYFLAAMFSIIKGIASVFNQKPTLNGPNVERPKQDQYVRVFGQAVNLAKVKKAQKKNQDPTLVPASWELIRLSPDKTMEVLAKHVAYYDLTDDGGVLHTNGFKVKEISSDASDTLFKHDVIECLRLI